MEIDLTVLGGRNIKAGDANGKSDGYVVVHYKGEKDETDIYEPSLFPEWNQVFRYKNVQVGDEFIFEVWDADRITKDDYLGKASYKIKKALVNGETKYKICPIDVKGNLYIQVKCITGGVEKTLKPLKKDRKMWLKVAIPETRVYPQALPLTSLDRGTIEYREAQSETEKKFQDAHKNLTKNLEFLQKMQQHDVADAATYGNAGDQSNMWVRVGVQSEDTPVQCTEKKKGIKYECIESKTYFYVKAKVGERLKFILFTNFGKGKSKDKIPYTYGYWTVPDMQQNEKLEMAVPSKLYTTFHTEIECIQSIYKDVIPEDVAPRYDPQTKEFYRYEVILHEALDVKSADFLSKSDPYFAITTALTKNPKKTTMIIDTKKPWYYAGFKIKCRPGSDMTFAAYDSDFLLPDKALGTCFITIPQDLKEDEEKEYTVNLTNKGKVIKTTVNFTVKRMRDVSQFYVTKFGPAGYGIKK